MRSRNASALTVITGTSLLAILGTFAYSDARVAPKDAQKPISTEIAEKTFGYSASGKSITGYVIGSGYDTILLFSAIHGNEKGTADLLNEFVDALKQNPSRIDASKKVVVIPVANPDGYDERSDKLNANAVNLNRNFATTGWKRYPGWGVFAGPEPFSEVESRVIRRVVEEYAPRIMIAFHSQGALVSPEFNAPSLKLGKWYAEKTGYTYFDEWDYPGTATKWFEETADGAAITVELTSYARSDWEINRQALFELVSA